MMNLITFVLILFSTPIFAQDSEPEYLTATECAERFTGDKLQACTLNALLVEAEVQYELVEAQRREAEEVVARVLAGETDRKRQLDEAVQAREKAERRLAEEAAKPAPTPVASAPAPLPSAPAMQIVRRGTEYAAVTHRTISGLASQLCIQGISYGVARHVHGKDIDVSSVRVVAMKDGIPLVPDLGMTVNTGPVLADLRGDGVIGVYTAFHPATDKACFDARPDEEITLAFLVDSGATGVMPGRGEATIYGGTKSQSVWVGYTKPGTGMTDRLASGGHVVMRMD